MRCTPLRCNGCSVGSKLQLTVDMTNEANMLIGHSKGLLWQQNQTHILIHIYTYIYYKYTLLILSYIHIRIILIYIYIYSDIISRLLRIPHQIHHPSRRSGSRIWQYQRDTIRMNPWSDGQRQVNRRTVELLFSIPDIFKKDREKYQASKC